MTTNDSKRQTRAEICGKLDRPGRALDDPSQVDWSAAGGSLDQARIVAALTNIDLRGKNLLHVGVGNSRLAVAFATKVNGIDGLTMHANEKVYADALGIRNYRVFVINKYSKKLSCLDNRYDFIIDNNLGSYACCKYHFYLMLDNYCEKLKQGGKILTDQRGMDWTYDCYPAWKMTYEELTWLGEVFPLRASKITSTVYALERL